MKPILAALALAAVATSACRSVPPTEDEAARSGLPAVSGKEAEPVPDKTSAWAPIEDGAAVLTDEYCDKLVERPWLKEGAPVWAYGKDVRQTKAGRIAITKEQESQPCQARAPLEGLDPGAGYVLLAAQGHGALLEEQRLHADSADDLRSWPEGLREEVQRLWLRPASAYDDYFAVDDQAGVLPHGSTVVRSRSASALRLKLPGEPWVFGYAAELAYAFAPGSEESREYGSEGGWGTRREIGWYWPESGQASLVSKPSCEGEMRGAFDLDRNGRPEVLFSLTEQEGPTEYGYCEWNGKDFRPFR